MNGYKVISRFAQVSVFGAQPSSELWAAAYAALLNGEEGVLRESYKDNEITPYSYDGEWGGYTGYASCVDGHMMVIKDGCIRTEYGANVHSAYVTVTREAIFLETDEEASENHWPWYEKVGRERAGGNLSAVRAAGILMNGGLAPEEFEVCGRGVVIRLDA